MTRLDVVRLIDCLVLFAFDWRRLRFPTSTESSALMSRVPGALYLSLRRKSFMTCFLFSLISALSLNWVGLVVTRNRKESDCCDAVDFFGFEIADEVPLLGLLTNGLILACSALGFSPGESTSLRGTCCGSSKESWRFRLVD